MESTVEADSEDSKMLCSDAIMKLSGYTATTAWATCGVFHKSPDSIIRILPLQAEQLSFHRAKWCGQPESALFPRSAQGCADSPDNTKKRNEPYSCMTKGNNLQVKEKWWENAEQCKGNLYLFLSKAHSTYRTLFENTWKHITDINKHLN